MDIEHFAEIVKKSVKKQLGNGYQVTVRKPDKQSGAAYTGLSVKKSESDIAPLINLDKHFQKYKNGSTTLPEITSQIVSVSKRNNLTVDMRQFLDYERIRKNIVYRLINTERNHELLEDIPHIKFMDMSIIFRCLISQDSLSTASILVHNAHLKLWDVSVDNLYQDAKENTQKLEGYEIKSMTEVMHEIMKTENPDGYDYDECMKVLSDNVPMYVLSNRNRVEGAACMLYSSLFREFADAVNSSFYIIPSSIHELLLIPDENLDERSGEIKGMIRDINDTQVKPEEILSYSLYCYDKEAGRITRR